MRFTGSCRVALLVALMCLCFLKGQSFAMQENKSIETSAPQDVVEGMATKAARGVANLATGWVEIPKQIHLTVKEDGVAKGLTIGPLKGVGMAVVRTLAGAADTLTFFVAYPGFFEPFFEPAYVWQKE